MRFIKAGTITSCVLVLGFGLGQIMAYSEYGDGQEELRLCPDIFYSSIIGLLSVSLSTLSLFIVWAAGNRYRRAIEIEAIIWTSMIVILVLTIVSIYSLLFGWAGAT